MAQPLAHDLLRDTEVRAYVAVLLASIALVSVMLAAYGTYDGYPGALRAAAFHVVSLATTTATPPPTTCCGRCSRRCC